MPKASAPVKKAPANKAVKKDMVTRPKVAMDVEAIKAEAKKAAIALFGDFLKSDELRASWDKAHIEFKQIKFDGPNDIAIFIDEAATTFAEGQMDNDDLKDYFITLCSDTACKAIDNAIREKILAKKAAAKSAMDKKAPAKKTSAKKAPDSVKKFIERARARKVKYPTMDSLFPSAESTVKKAPVKKAPVKKALRKALAVKKAPAKKALDVKKTSPLRPS